jgi:hypothetical protein
VAMRRRALLGRAGWDLDLAHDLGGDRLGHGAGWCWGLLLAGAALRRAARLQVRARREGASALVVRQLNKGPEQFAGSGKR